MTVYEAEQLAKAIAERLFVNGFGDRASRLQLRSEGERDLGGWCRSAAETQIVQAILAAPKEQ